MKKDKTRLDHALNNEKACDYLSLHANYKDWVITTAFYSALQFVSYKIFPFIHSDSGKDTKIESIDQYKGVLKTDLNKHKLLRDLVEDKCAEIHEDYSWLLSYSYSARYVNYQYPVEVSNRAKSLLAKIKTHCTK